MSSTSRTPHATTHLSTPATTPVYADAAPGTSTDESGGQPGRGALPNAPLPGEPRPIDALRARYAAAPTFDEFLPTAEKNAELWRNAARLVKVPDDVVARVAALGGTYHLLVLSEDWCGDAVNSVPYVARLADLAPNLDLRVLARDENLDFMDAHLTGASRSIPVVIVYDADFRELGWWGPRPSELQAWALGPGRALEKEARYKEVRTWYARDRGRSTLAEVVGLLEQAAGQTAP